MEELTKIINNISIHKSSGIPDLSTRFLRDTLLYIPNAFLHIYIYNRVRVTAIFPGTWKIATVIPLPKCSNPTELSELRPVSLLPLVGKLLENLIHLQLSEFLENSKLLPKNQHGFRKGFSTTSAASTFIDDIVLGLDKGHFTLAVFLDIKKAFDTIYHKIIIQKLEYAGVGARTLSLIANYLDRRKQCVLYNGIRPDVKKLYTGVPQGSTLGLLLFLIYVNDLPNVFANTKCMMFADDTVLYQSHPNINELYNQIQLSLNKMYSWCQANIIKLL